MASKYYLKSANVIQLKNGNKVVKFEVLPVGAYTVRVKWSKEFKGSRSDDEILDDFFDRALQDAGLDKDLMTNKAYNPDSNPIEKEAEEAI